MADENSKPDDPASEPAAGIPEVEAEIVEDGEPPAQEGVFTDRETNADAAGVEADEKPAPKRMPFTPGVILFFGFAGFALIIFVMWRLQGPVKAPVIEAPQQQEEALPSADVPEETEVDVPVLDNTEDNAPAPDFAGNAADNAAGDAASNAIDADAGPLADAATSADSGKIENSQFSELKNADDDIDPVAEVSPGGDVYLPPLGSENAKLGDNQALQQAAKEAHRAFEPTTESALPEDAGKQTTPTDQALAFDVESVDAVMTAPSQSDIDRQPHATGGEGNAAGASENDLAATVDQTAIATGGSDENAKLLNDIAALKQSFEAEKAQLTNALEDERQRNAAQRDEIEALRRDFQAALTARDDQANAEKLELRERLDKIRNDEITPIARRVAGASALRFLERVFDAGGPFNAELDRFEQAAPGAPAIVILRKYAEAGIVPMQQQKERFGAAASNALAAARKEQAKGMTGVLIAQAQNIITIRPAKPRPGSGPGAVISRAEYAVENSDLEGALAELASLSPAGRDAMASWIVDAQARTEAASAMRDLNNLVFGALSQ